MTTYTDIDNNEIDANSPLTVTLMTKYRDNPIAITEGASGAPKIQTAAYDTASVDQAALAADCVGQSEVNTTVSEHDLSDGGGSGTTESTSFATTTTSAGTYALSVSVQMNTAGQAETHRVSVIHAEVGGGNDLRFAGEGGANLADGGQTAAFRVRYIEACPPYDLGDGDVPLFVCLAIEKGSGNIRAVSAAPDPVWANNGPTNTRPDFRAPDGTGYIFPPLLTAKARRYGRRAAQLRARVLLNPDDAQAASQLASVLDQQAKVEEELADIRSLLRRTRIPSSQGEVASYRKARMELSSRLTVVDQSVKNADMNLIPHNYIDWDPSLFDFVYLDPCETEDLLDVLDSGDYVTKYVRDALIIHNDDITRSVPNGTRAVRFSKR